MENIVDIKSTDVLSYISKLEANSIHAITVDEELDDLIVQQSLRVLKHGGFLLVMTLPKRMYQDGATLLKNKFKIVDSIHWLQTDTPDNSFTVGYLIERMNYLDKEDKEKVKLAVKDLKIPKLRRSHIPIIIAQKPPLKNQTLNHYKEGVGLLQSVRTASGRSCGNIFTTEFGVSPYHFLLPRIKEFEKELFSRAWSHILKQFTTDGTHILDLTKGHHAVLPCIHLKRKYKTCMELKDLDPFLRKCGTFLTRKVYDKDRWSMCF